MVRWGKGSFKEEKRRAETHHKCVMGGLVTKYLPECYQFEESELNNIIRAAVFSADCKKVVAKVKSGSAGAKAETKFHLHGIGCLRE